MKWILTMYLIIFFPFSIKTKNHTIINYKVQYEQVRTLKKQKIPNDLRKLADYIKQHEGLVLTPYYCPGGLLSIGYGHSIKKGEFFTSITEHQADSILLSDINLCRNFVKEKFNLQDGKLIAITHFVFAVGSGNLWYSKLKDKIRNGDSINSELMKWTKIKGKFSKQLLKHREWELSNYYN